MKNIQYIEKSLVTFARELLTELSLGSRTVIYHEWWLRIGGIEIKNDYSFTKA